MEINMYAFRIEYGDDYDGDYHVHKQNGFIAATSYADAMKRLSEWYGEDYIINVEYMMAMCNDPIIVPACVFEAVVQEETFNVYC